jgi:GNAT superfamily N-acetyltransferase
MGATLADPRNRVGTPGGTDYNCAVPSRAPEPELVRATPDEWVRWREVRLRALTADPDAFGSSLEIERDWTAEQWRTRLASGHDWMAVVDGAAVATAGWFVREPGLCDVVAMWVDPAWRGRGLGRLVLDAVVEEVRAAGLRARLWVADGNPARRLYEHAGFVATGARAPIRPGATATKSLLVLL